MLRYALRRFGHAAISACGAVILIFAIVHLAPGDPASVGEGSALPSVEQVESRRRSLALDLPLFFNPSPQGIEGRFARLRRGLQRNESSGWSAISACGTLCLPLWKEGLSGAAAKSRADELLKRHPRWRTAIETNSWAPLEARLSQLPQLVSKLGQDASAETSLVALGSAAIGPVLTTVLSASGKQQVAASRVASQLTNMPWVIDTPASAPRVKAHWAEWWRQYAREHRRLSASERFWGRFTETQFARWLGRLARFDLGVSWHDSRLVSTKLAEALPVTLWLSIAAILLAYLVAIPLGSYLAMKRGSRAERVISGGLLVAYATPAFVVAMLLLMLFGGVGFWDVFPIHGISSRGADTLAPMAWLSDRLWHMVLPVTCLAYGAVLVLTRYHQDTMSEVLGQRFILAAHARGLSRKRILFGHALPNASLTLITMLGLQLPFLVSGSVIVERIFDIPGMGLLAFDAFLQRDYPTVMAIAAAGALLTVLGLFLADLAYAWADPRIRTARGRA